MTDLFIDLTFRPRHLKSIPKWNDDNTAWVSDEIYGAGWIGRVRKSNGQWREVRYLTVYPFHSRARALEALARGAKKEVYGHFKTAACWRCGSRTQVYCRACGAPACSGAMNDCQLPHRLAQRSSKPCPLQRK